MQDNASTYFIKDCVIACIRFEGGLFNLCVSLKCLHLKNFALKRGSSAWETDTNRDEKRKERKRGIKLPAPLFKVTVKLEKKGERTDCDNGMKIMDDYYGNCVRNYKGGK